MLEYLKRNWKNVNTIINALGACLGKRLMTLELEALVAYIDIVLGVGKLWIKREGKELRKRTNKNYVMKKMINQLEMCFSHIFKSE